MPPAQRLRSRCDRMNESVAVDAPPPIASRRLRVHARVRMRHTCGARSGRARD